MFIKSLFKLPLLLIYIAGPALATDSTSIECDSCTTNMDFSNVATENAMYNSTLIVNVMNFANFELRKYEVTSKSSFVCEDEGEPDGEGGVFNICKKVKTVTAKNKSISNDELTSFSDLATAIKNSKMISQRSIEVPPSIVDSGYDFITTANAAGKTSNYYNSIPLSQSFLEQLNLVLGGISKLFPNGVLNFEPPYLVFEFADGTKVNAKLAYIDMNNTVNFKYLKLIDPNGTIIKLDKDQPFKVGVLYDFSNLSNSTWHKVYNFMSFNGFVVRGLSSKIPPPGNVLVSCENKTETVCKHPQ